MARTVIEVKGKKYEVVPDGMVDSYNESLACDHCDLLGECDHHATFCRDDAYRVHFKLARERYERPEAATVAVAEGLAGTSVTDDIEPGAGDIAGPGFGERERSVWEGWDY